ncbi:MAG: DUF1846 family protein, partial [Eubacteriales bacterium]
TDIISPDAISPIQALKTGYLGSSTAELLVDETLIALSISAATDTAAKSALDQLPKLSGCQLHTTTMPESVDLQVLQKLGVQVTSEARY